MAKKPSTKKSLKSLFSRSEAHPKESVEKEEKSNGGEKKKFKLFKFSLKSKSNTALEKTANARSSESVILSDSDEVFLESGRATSKSSTLFATAPRSKAKDLSLSELDLHKAKKSGTFSFHLRRKKRDKDREEMSKSVIGLHGPWTQERRKHMDVSQWEPALATRQGGAFAMSQPELDTAETFDIPGAPPLVAPSLLAPSSLASKRSSSEAFLSRKDPPTVRDPAAIRDPPTLHDSHGRLRSLETLLDSPDAFDVDREMGEVPIATMPELLLTAPSSPASSPRRHDPGKNQAQPFQNPIAGPTESAVDGPSAIPGGAPAESQTAAYSPLPFTRSTDPVLSPVVLIQNNKMNSVLPVAHNAAKLPNGSDSTRDTARSTASFKMDAAAIKTLLDRSRTNPVNASSPLFQDDGSVPDFPDLNGEPRSSVGSSDRGSPSADDTPMSGETYPSVFSQSLTTEVFSAMLNTWDPSDQVMEEELCRQQPSPPPACDQERFDPPPRVHDNGGFPKGPTDPGDPEHGPPAVDVVPDVAVSTTDPVDRAYRTPTDSDDRGATPTYEDPLTETEHKHHVLSTLYDSLLPVSLHQTNPTMPCPDPQLERPSHAVTTTSSTVHSDPEPAGLTDSTHSTGRLSPSEGSVSYSAVKPEEFGPVGNTEAPVSQMEPPAPPHSNHPSSPGTADTQTQVALVPKRSGIVTVGDNVLTSPAPFPPLETMTALNQQGTLETMAEGEEEEEEAAAPAEEEEQQQQETFSAARGQLDVSACEPVLLSVGSDGSSAMDVFFSAEEDNASELDDSELDDISTLAESDDLGAVTEDTSDRAAREDLFTVTHGPDGPPGTVSASGDEGREAARLSDRIEMEGRRLGGNIEGQQQAARKTESPPSPSPPIYSPPPPLPEWEQQERGGTGTTETWRRRIDMWGERLDKQEEGGEEGEEPRPALPVQQVETVMECEPALPFSQVCNKVEEEEEEEGVGENLKPLILPVTGEQPETPSQVPDPLGREYLPHNGSRRAEANAQHVNRDTHTIPDVSTGLSTSALDSSKCGETGEARGGAVSPVTVKAGVQETSAERSPAIGSRADPVDRGGDVTRAKTPIALTYAPPLTVSRQATTSSSSTSSSSSPSSPFFGIAKPSDASERVTAEQIETGTASPVADVVRVVSDTPEQTPVSQADEDNDGSGLDAPTEIGVHLPSTRPIEPQGSPATGPAPGLQDLHLSSSTTSESPLGADPHPGPQPPPPPVAEMSSAYSTTLYLPRHGSSSGKGDADPHQESTTTSSSRPPEVKPTRGDVSAHPWRNTFNGVSQYRPGYSSPTFTNTDSSTLFPDSPVPSVPSSSSSSHPEASLDTQYYLHPAPTSTSTSTTGPLQTYGSLGNRRSDGRKVVYVSTRSVPLEEPEADGAAAAAAAAAGGGRGGGGSGRWSREWEEPGAAPVREAETQTKEIKLSGDTTHLAVDRLSSSECNSGVAAAADSRRHSQEDEVYTGVFTATRVDLITEPSSSPVSPVSPDVGSSHLYEMEVLKDTLKSMGPSPGIQKQRSLRGAPFGFSSLAPIVEDTPSPTSTSVTSASSSFDATDSSAATAPSKGLAPAPEGLGGRFGMPLDLGLGSPMSPRSPLDLMKTSQQDQLQQNGTWGLGRPLRASASNSIVMRLSADDTPSPSSHNGNGLQQLPAGSSRLDQSVLFSSYRSSPADTPPDNPLGSRSLFRASSLPDTGGSSYDRISKGPRENGGFGGVGGHAGDTPPSAYDRFSFLLNSTSNSPVPGSGSLTGAEDLYSRISRGPHFNGTSASGPGNSPQRLLSPTADFPRTPTSFGANATDMPFSMYGQAHGPGGMGPGTGVPGAPLLQRSFGSEGGMGGQQYPPSSLLFNNSHMGSHFQAPEPAEPEKPLATKYRAFPDAYLTKEKEHGKLNPRPGKIFIYDRPGMCGQRIEVRSDVVDATSWDLQETISIRVVRGGWVMYEKPNFKGEKVALDEGDLELTCPFMCPEDEEEEVVVAVQPETGKQNGVEANGDQNGEQSGEPAEKPKPARKFIIGSLRRTVRDYSVPEISLFPEENAEGKKVTFRDTCEDARIFGFPVKANSIIINAGLWLVYAEPFFQGVPRVLEVGGFTNPAAWTVEQPYVGSLHPLKIGEPRVENIDEPQMIIYDKPYFSGKSRTIHGTMKNFMTRTTNQQTAFMYNAGSIKVVGGIWVGYEKEGFRGHQYLLEEGDYHDWRVWGGCNAEMRSVKVIRADLSEPMLMMFEQPEDEDLDEENSFEVTDAIPDVATFQYKTTTRSINVLSGAWVAYSHVDYSGNQYILEKGFYNNSADWGSEDNVICSIQPILPAPTEGSKARNEVLLYSEADFQGKVETFNLNQEEISAKVLAKSCRLVGGGWVLYDTKDYTGNQCVLSDGEYPNLFSMGCKPTFTIRSLRAIPLVFSIPSISLFSMECLEGKEITTDMEMSDLMADGFNNHFMSVRVNSGCWVLCEFSHYRGRQFLLEPIEITNWLKFSSLETVGSMYPVRQKRRFFRIKNQEHRNFLCLNGGLEEMKPGRVVVAAEPEHDSDIWFYDEGFLKNKMSSSMSLQVMGTVEPGCKVVLWTDTRQPLQTWSAPMSGRIPSLTFPGLVLDVKGGKSYDKDFVVMLPEDEERASQQWQLELL